MKKRELFDMLSDIDSELVERSEKEGKNKKVWIKWTALAACLCIVSVVGIGISIPLIEITSEGTNSETTKDTPAATQPTIPEESELRGPDTPPSDSHGLLKLPVIQSGNKISDKTEINIGGGSANSYSAEILPAAFYMRIVVEAEVIEVLPDEYSGCRVALLRIKDTIVGSGMPSEIHLKYNYYNEDVFDGYDSFILSLEQCGTKNYPLVNSRTSEVEYFPDMFRIYNVADLGYGSVLAFKNGIVDENFTYSLNAVTNFNKEYLFSESEGNRYPARIGSTVEQVKEKIIELANDDSYNKNRNTEYADPERIFASDKAKEFLQFVSSGKNGNVFTQTFSYNGEKTIVSCRREINGFSTQEVITLTVYSDGRAEVDHIGDEFTATDLESIPDLSAAMNFIEEDIPAPMHIDTSGFSMSKLTVTGKYRKIDGKVWGVVRLRWQYCKNGSHAYLEDDMYFLYDSEGNGRMMERDELREVIGDDGIILNFPYGLMIEVAV